MPSGSKPIDISNQKFGLLMAIDISGRDKHKNVIWKCICDCGNYSSVSAADLRSGHTKSCGCLKISMLKSRVTKHGSCKTNLYLIWQQMLARCYKKQNKSFEFYGARGIEVCDEWRNSFETFAREMGNPPKGMSLERINNSIGYAKGNCKWASRLEQANNMRSNIIIFFDGKHLTMAQFSRMLGFKYEKVRSAVNRGVKNIGGYEINVARRSDIEIQTKLEIK